MNMALRELQVRMAASVMQPLTRREGMRQRSRSGISNVREAESFIRPNDRLSSFERLEIYNRQYWFRLFSSFEEDFPGLKAVIGQTKFQVMMRSYLEECPSTSFTLRNLGSRLVDWLKTHRAETAPNCELAEEMAALEWAHIETFDGAVWPRLDLEQLQTIGEASRITLQPYLRLIAANHAIDDALIAVRRMDVEGDVSSNNASSKYVSKRRHTLHNLKREKVYLLIHRYEDSVYYRRLVMEDYLLLSALQDGKMLGVAIEEGFAQSEMAEEQRPAHLQSAFTYWTSMGWFCAGPDDREGISG